MIVKKNTLAFWSGLEYRDPPFLNRVYLVPESSERVYSKDTPNSEYFVVSREIITGDAITIGTGENFRVMASNIFTLITEPKVHPSKLTCTWNVRIIRGSVTVVLVARGDSPGDDLFDYRDDVFDRELTLTALGRTRAMTLMADSPYDTWWWTQRARFGKDYYFSEQQINCKVMYNNVVYDAGTGSIKISRPKGDYTWDFQV